jgi:hypothetical protein
MFQSKRWMMAGAAAAVLGAGTARATTEPRTVTVDVDESGYQPGLIPANDGEQVRLVFTRTAGSPVAALVLQDHGIMAPLPLRQPVAVTVRSAGGGVGYTIQPFGEVGRAALTDEQELAAGNTGGRG